LDIGVRLGFTEEARFRDARQVRSEWDAATDHARLTS
jgi:hypothetical protein